MEVLYDIHISKDSFNGDSNANVLEKFSQKYKMIPDDFLKMLESRTNVRIAQNKTKDKIGLLYSRLNKLNIKAHIREHLEIAKDNANGDSASQSQATST